MLAIPTEFSLNTLFDFIIFFLFYILFFYSETYFLERYDRTIQKDMRNR